MDLSTTPDLLASGTILPAGDGGAPGRRTPWWVLAVAAAAVAALVGGVTYGVTALSGGGRQAADALPSGAAAFVSVDLDPPAGQKVDALRFLRQFPSLKKRLGGDGDLRKAVFDAVAGPAGWSRLDFDSDVAPWLGQRVGAAAYPSSGAGSSPDVVVALQVSDEDGATKGLATMLADGGAQPGYVITDGYVLLAGSQAAADRAADRAAQAALSTDEHFSADVADLGDAVATVWTDSSRAAKLLPQGGPAGAVQDVPGRAAFALRFAGADALELAGRVVGGTAATASTATVARIGELPADTVAAAELAGGADLVAPIWKQLTSGAGTSAADVAEQARDQFGLDLPADLRTLLGSQMVVALDAAGLSGGQPSVGARVTTDDPQKADRLVGRLLGQVPVPGGANVVHRQTADGYVFASTDEQADRLSSSAPKRLGDDPDFRRALPDLSSARFAVWVDVAAAVTAYVGGGEGEVTMPDLEPVAGVGLSVATEQDGVASFRLRVVTH